MPAENRQLVDRRFRLALSLFIAAGTSFLLVCAGALPAQAGGVVTDCSDAGDFNAKLAGGGLVTFACGPNPPTIVLTSTKTIVSDTSIDGGGVITLSGGGSRRLFIIPGGKVLALNNLAITDGFDPGDGGAIFNSGDLSIDQSRLENNHTAVTGSGGAIVSYGPLTITNSTLAYNSAANGGALYPRFSAARTLIVNSVLHDNVTTSPANGWGGALLSWGDGPVTIDGSAFYSNTARSGGALYGIAFSMFTLTSSTITNNVALTGTGGGMDLAGTAIISGSQFAGNFASGTGGFDGGGGLNITYSGTVTISGSKFEANQTPTANGVGGAIMNFGSLTVTQSTFISNTAKFGGGIGNNPGRLTLSDVTLSGNSALTRGGGIDTQGTVTMTHVTLSGNSAGFGGGIQSAGFVTMTNSTVDGNSALNYVGGGIMNLGYLWMYDSTISNNTAATSGGGLENESNAALVNSTFSGNSAVQNGGGVDQTDYSLTLMKVTLTNNSASSGGALSNQGSMTVSQSVIVSNTASSLGGAIYNGTNRSLLLDQARISANHAFTDGGAIWNSGSIALLNSTMYSNAADQNGGAVSNSGYLMAINSTLSGNRANADGGAIHNTTSLDGHLIGLVNFYNVTVAFNSADADNNGSGAGGGLFNVVTGTLNLRNNLVTGNTLHDTVPDDCSGIVRSYGRNLFSAVGGGCTISIASGSWALLNGFTPIGPLADHGGPTPTHALLPGTNAIDGGDPVQGCVDDQSVLLSTDQRGVPRPEGLACDVGAYEFEGAVQWLYLPLIDR